MYENERSEVNNMKEVFLSIKQMLVNFSIYTVGAY